MILNIYLMVTSPLHWVSLDGAACVPYQIALGIFRC